MTNTTNFKNTLFNNAHKVIQHKVIMIAALMLLTISTFFSCLFNHVFSSFSPVSYDNATAIDLLTEAGEHYVNCTVDKLYYTGYNYEKGGHVKGYYYYSLTNNLCTIYLINADELTAPAQILENAAFRARLNANDSNLNALLKYMANDLNWNYYGISRYASTTVISQYDYKPVKYIFSALFTILIVLCDIVFVIHLYIDHKKKQIHSEKRYSQKLKHSKKHNWPV